MKAFLAAAAVTSAEPSVAVVAGTGISLVFLILVLLTLIITLQGKIFGVIEQRKKAKAAPAQAAEQAPAPAAPVKCPPFVEEGIPEEVVAAIAAAVAASSGGKDPLRSLTRAASGRGSWGAAGAVSGTEPF